MMPGTGTSSKSSGAKPALKGSVEERASVPVWGCLLFLILATAVAYLPAVRGELLWDDDAHITKPELQSAAGLGRIWFQLGATQQYYPLLHTAFWIEYQLWQNSLFAYHALNIALHAAAACLVYLILRKLRVSGAFLAAAIFAVHPVNVESVAWISEQKNTLSAMFYLGAMLCYLRYDEGRNKGRYALASLLFVLGLLTKTVTATLPAALLVIFWWQRGKISWRRDVLPLIPWFVVAVASGLFTAWVERKLIGAEGTAFELTLAQRLLLAGRAPWFYLSKLVWPGDLMFIYPRWNLDPTDWRQWLYPAGTVLLLIVLWLVRARWRGPLAAWLFFLGTLFPVLGFFNVYPFIYSFVADHFQYLASLGMIALFVAGVCLAIARMQGAIRYAGYGLCGVILVCLGAVTWRQSESYANAVELYQTTLEKNPSCWMARYNLGVLWAKQGENARAIECYQAVLQTKPDYAPAGNNLGQLWLRMGQTPNAEQALREAIRMKPEFAGAHSNLGVALMKLGRQQEALDQFQQAADLAPNTAELQYDLANALLLMNQLPEAIDHYQRAVRLNNNYSEAYANLAIADAKLNRADEALAAADRAWVLAKSQGKTEFAQQIKAWFDHFRSTLQNGTGESSSMKQ